MLTFIIVALIMFYCYKKGYDKSYDRGYKDGYKNGRRDEIIYGTRPLKEAPPEPKSNLIIP